MKKKAIFWFLPLLVMCNGSYSGAAESGGHELTLNLSAGALQFDGADHLRDSFIYDVRLGYDIVGRKEAQSLGIEVGGSSANSRSENDGKSAKAYLLRVDATYPLSPPQSRTLPFLALGLGARLIDRDSSFDSSPLLAYGAGIKYFITDSLALRVDWRHNLIYDNVGTVNNFQYLAGFSYILHSDKPVQRIPVPRPKPKDTKKKAISSQSDATKLEQTPPVPAQAPVSEPAQKPVAEPAATKTSGDAQP